VILVPTKYTRFFTHHKKLCFLNLYLCHTTSFFFFVNVGLLNICLRFILRSPEKFFFSCCVDRFLRGCYFSPSSGTFQEVFIIPSTDCSYISSQDEHTEVGQAGKNG
jgi:hypothetical protein